MAKPKYIPKQAIDLTGQRFNRLVVLEYAGQRGNGKKKRTSWRCLCDCGNNKISTIGDLRSGNTGSCGCLQKERASEASFNDRTGVVYGRLTALRPVMIPGRHNLHWECVCECGNVAIIQGGNLTMGITTSCGCYKTEFFTGENNHRWNPDKPDGYQMNSPKVMSWRMNVFERDCFTCQYCEDAQGHNLNAHHIVSWNKNEKLRFITGNGITLCKTCHIDFHGIYGYGNNNRAQLMEWLSPKWRV